MSISISIHRIVKAEAHTCRTGSHFSYITVQDDKGFYGTFVLPDGPEHEKRAKYLAEAFRLAFKFELTTDKPEYSKEVAQVERDENGVAWAVD